MSAKGGITEGKSHAEGGIPMVVKSTGQNVELEGGEGVINKRNMASTKTFDFEGKKMTICEIASKINSADGNGVQIDCENVTGTKYKYAEGGQILNEDEESEFKIWFEDGNVIEFEKDVYSTQDAQYRNRLKGMDELRKYFRKEFLSDNNMYSEGGNVNQELKMDYDFRSLLLPNEKQFFLQNNTKAIQHNNLFIFTDGKREIVFSRHKTKLKKLGNASKSTKELYDKYFADGGYVDLETYNFNELRGKYVYLYSMGVEFPEEYQIVDVTLTSPQFRYRDLTLKFDLGNAKIKFDDIEDFLHEEIVYVKTDKEEFGVQLIPNQFAKGGRTKNAMKTDDYENASLSMDSYEDGAISSNPTEFANGGGVENMPKSYQLKRTRELSIINEYLTKAGGEPMTEQDVESVLNHYNPTYFYEIESKVFSLSGADEENLKVIEKRRLGEAFMFFKRKPKMAQGGGVDLPKANKMFHLPLELAVYVPSTQDVDKVISDSELKERVDEVSEYLARLFGGFTKSDKIGGFMSSKSELVTEDVVPVVSFATKDDFNANKDKLVNKLSEWAKRWGQEAIGFEFEGDLYYVPESFANGGDIKKIKYGNMTKHKYAEGGRVRYYLNGFEESLNYILNSTNGKEVRREGSKENGDLVIYFETTDEKYAQGGGIKHSYEITQEGNEFIVEFLKSNGELDWGRGGFSSREEAEKYALENRRYAKGGGVGNYEMYDEQLYLDNDLKDAILENDTLSTFIKERHFIRDKNGKLFMWIDWMDNDQFDKLANFLGYKYAKGGGVYRHKYVVQWLEDDNLNREYYYSDEYEEAKELYYQIKYDLGDSQYKKFGINIMDIETGEIVFGDEFEYAKGGGVDNQKVFEAQEDGILGIYSGSDAYTIEISKGDRFATFGKQDDGNWWFVKKINVKPISLMLENTFDYNQSKSNVPLEIWQELVLTFPKGENSIYAEMKEVFAKGGDVRDMSWYQDFKKQELKRGTEHEMEHIESIKKFKKKGVSDREVAKAIAKDHLDENENYYIELEKMQESSEKVSNALQDFEHQKSKRKSSRKYKLGGYMGDNKSVNVHLFLVEDYEAVVRSKDGTYLNDVNLKKDKVYKFGFLFDEGQNVAFDLGDGSDSYILVPSNLVVVVGYDEEKMELGGEVKSYADYNLDRNDKSILKLLLNINPRNATAEQRDKVSTFKGNNIVNDLSPKLIQKIYGILFQNHNVDNKILNLYITNIGVGNIVMYAPSYLHKTMVGFDEKNQFVQVEKEIANIVTEGKRVFLFNEFELSDMDGFIHVYPKSNPEVDTLCGIFYKTKKKAVALGVCEFTSREKLDAFQRSIGINQGSMALNQMISFAKSNDYLIVNEGITSEGAYTLIYTMTKY